MGALEAVSLAALSGLGARSESLAEACHSLLHYQFNEVGFFRWTDRTTFCVALGIFNFGG